MVDIHIYKEFTISWVKGDLPVPVLPLPQPVQRSGGSTWTMSVCLAR